MGIVAAGGRKTKSSEAGRARGWAQRQQLGKVREGREEGGHLLEYQHEAILHAWGERRQQMRGTQARTSDMRFSHLSKQITNISGSLSVQWKMKTNVRSSSVLFSVVLT